VSVAELPDRRDDPSVDLGRTPPQDVAAEQSVLGGMLLSKDAIADVVEILRGHDFYRPAHESIFEAVIDLYGRGEPADAVTVAAALQKSSALGRVGGAPYLHTLVSSVPSAANAGFYAEIVRERALLRRLVEAGTRIVQMGYGDDGDADDIVDRAQAEVYAVTERRTSEDYLPLSDIMEGALDEIESIGSRGGQMIGVPTGFADLDSLTNGLHSGQLVILAARPAVGKSTLGLDIARAASVKHGLTSVIFSLEMSRNEITMRLLSAEAKVPLHHMRSGQMTDDDWNRIARSTGEVSSAPLYIDDSPNMTMMEIRAKCRRLRQRHSLRLIVVDYMQLMTSGKRVESRQQEVSEFSRALKLLAKELEVPVVAISQLNRGPEQRQDKKPMLSDLRESGCLPASTHIVRADTGAEVTLGELLTTGSRDIPVWSLNEGLRYVPRVMTHAFPSGRKETFRLRLASGRQVDATANHPFLTFDGWCPLGRLTRGNRIAVPRHVPAPMVVTPWADAEVILLAHLLGDGSSIAEQPIRYHSVHEDNLRAVMKTAKHFGVMATRHHDSETRVGTVSLVDPPGLTDHRRHPIIEWLDRLGLVGRSTHEKFIPSSIFSLPTAQVALFVRHLWATDGVVAVDDDYRGGQIWYPATSRAFLADLSRLLLRFGIATRIQPVNPGPGDRLRYALQIVGRDEQLRFLRAIGSYGANSQPCRILLAGLDGHSQGHRGDAVSPDVWHRVRAVLAQADQPQRESIEAARLGQVAAVLNDAELDIYATNDVLWDEIIEIEPRGMHDVYDATVLGTHNFIANGIVTHNSIEQDADMVVLLHREDAYEKESPRAGEADFIVAKHRNGPTATITVAFQGHYSRFVDMAH
jgi:replicative DNA helicase